MLHAHAEAEGGERLEHEQQSDGDHQPAERVVAHGAKQGALGGDAHEPDEDEPGRDREQEGQMEVRVDGDDAVGPEHVELAVGEVDDPHHAEYEHQPHRDQGQVAGRVGRVDDGLEQQLGHGGNPRPALPIAGRAVSLKRNPAPGTGPRRGREFAGGDGTRVQPRW